MPTSTTIKKASVVVMTGERTGGEGAIRTRYDLSLSEKNCINVLGMLCFSSVNAESTDLHLSFLEKH